MMLYLENSTYLVTYAGSYSGTLKNLIHTVEFQICGTLFGGFHRAASFHPINEGRLFFSSEALELVFSETYLQGNFIPSALSPL
jgi:hypothetical protein